MTMEEANIRFNAVQELCGTIELHLSHLSTIDAVDGEEVRDLMRDVNTLARRIDRLHHDTADEQMSRDPRWNANLRP
jgi:hypothetical protein